MWREQKTAEASWPLGGKVEPEVPKGAWSIKTPESAERDRAELFEQVSSIGNTFNACEGVVRPQSIEPPSTEPSARW
jgi:hypothetical protein